MPPARPADALTHLHIEYVALLASGKSVDQIAKAKHVVYRTASRKLKQAADLVGAETLPSLCALCVEAGLITRVVIDEKGSTEFRPVVDPFVT